MACEVLSLHYRINPDYSFALCSFSLLCLHSQCLIPMLGGPLGPLCSSHSSVPLRTQGILLIDLINESLSWFILLRLSCFSAVWSARHRKSSCTQVDLTLVHLSKALSSYSFGTCKWCTRMFVDDDHPQSPGGFYFIGSCLLFCMAKLSWLLSEFGTQARVPQPQTKCKEFSDRGRLGPSTLRGGNPIWEECSQRGET